MAAPPSDTKQPPIAAATGTGTMLPPIPLQTNEAALRIEIDNAQNKMIEHLKKMSTREEAIAVIGTELKAHPDSPANGSFKQLYVELHEMKTGDAGGFKQWQKRVTQPSSITNMGAALPVLQSAAINLQPRPGYLRILSLDGGGVRGLVTIQVLISLYDQIRKIAADNGITPHPHISRYFDVIYGTSTGGILSAALRSEMSLTDIHTLFKTLPKEIFGSMWKTTNLEKLLNENIDASKRTIDTFACAPFAVISRNLQQATTAVFRNFGIDAKSADMPKAFANAPAIGSCKELKIGTWLDALRSTSAAYPEYFSTREITLASGVKHQFVDGGFGNNHPGNVVFKTHAEHFMSKDTKTVWLSLGTGESSVISQSYTNLWQTKDLLINLVTGTAEINELATSLMSVPANPNRVYGRINPSGRVVVERFYNSVDCELGAIDLAEYNEAVLQEMRAVAKDWVDTTGADLIKKWAAELLKASHEV